MKDTLLVFEVVVAILLILIILLQHRGTSLGGAFGGEGNVYRSRRGVEKFLFSATVVLGTLFVALAIANLFF